VSVASTFARIPGAEPWSHHPETADVGVGVIHGFSGNPVTTRPVGEALAEAGYGVEVPCLPGHGTHWRHFARTRYADWRVAVDRVYESLSRQYASVVLVGLSMGGTLALDVAAGRLRSGLADELAGVAVINPQLLDREDPLSRLAPILQHLVPFVPAPLADIRSSDIKKGGDEKAYWIIPAKTGYSFTRELPRVRRDLPDVTVPVLVAGSAEDHTVPVKNWAYAAEAVGSEDVTTLRLEDSWHVATLDHDAELLNEAIIDFVARATSDEQVA
jgi:carboxylesterase